MKPTNDTTTEPVPSLPLAAGSAWLMRNGRPVSVIEAVNGLLCARNATGVSAAEIVATVREATQLSSGRLKHALEEAERTKNGARLVDYADDIRALISPNK